MIWDCESAPLAVLQHSLRVENRRREKKWYLDLVCCFDIESTRIVEIEQAVMYIWQMQIGPNVTVTGRTWEEYFRLLDRIREQLPEDTWLAVYVHNLSYEFSFLKGVYPFEPDEVFATDFRKILKCTMYGCIEYRCSYHLTNMSLDAFLKKMNVPNRKTTLEYGKIRWPWTELTDEEIEYCVNDVKGLQQGIEKMMKGDGDDIATIPMTATGYVRRDVREAMQKFNHTQMYYMQPDEEVYGLLREAFRGGDTLSNRWMTDKIIENVKSVDIVSSYPASMLLDKFPMSTFCREQTEDFRKLLDLGKRALLFRVTFVNIRAEMTEGHLYLSRDKCRDIIHGTFANGRIVRAECLDTTITDVDFRIIERRYKWERMYVTELWSARYRMLPWMFRDVIKKYYRVKTELKGISDEDPDYLYYMKNKEKLNASYGMTVQDPARDSIEYVGGEFRIKEELLADMLKKNARTAFLSYAWGVWVAARSRARLAAGIDIVTKNGAEPVNFIYSDTDSIKYIGDADFSAYNEDMEKQATLWGAYAADRNGEVHYMGVYESEGYRLPNRFKTLGAKKYVLEDPDGHLHITIAGVNKKKGGKELGTLENFREGFIFREAGGTEAVFNDNVDMWYNVDGHRLHIRDNEVIRDSTYTLGITAEYRMILDGLASIKYADEDIDGIYKVKR